MHLVAVGFSSFSKWVSYEISKVHLSLLTVRFPSMLICELIIADIHKYICVIAADKMLSVKRGQQLQMCKT